jgi:hypothetical protein
MSIKQITTGQDSFLDIVANLVGVLIILVVVIGAQASSAWSSAESSAEPNTDRRQQIVKRLDAASSQLKSLESDNNQIEKKIDDEMRVVANLTNTRHQMLVQLRIVEKEVEARRREKLKQLNDRQKAALLENERRVALEDELANIRSELKALDAYQPKSETIDHYPNPIAKTVFTDEIHFQIRNGKIAFVPLNELVSRMKSEWKFKAEKLRGASRTLETVGPIENFRLQYELRSVVAEPVHARRQMVRFERFTIFPTTERIGEAVTQSSLGQSRLVNRVSQLAPEKTTVSLWVYPDSFTQYNLVKDWLYEQGYQVACWPLDFDRRISGGPNGFRTSAQ